MSGQTPITITPQLARRLSIAAQRLAGPRPESIMDVLRSIRCLQLDPIRAVEHTQRLVLWSRLGHYDIADFLALRWQERQLFEYWAHAASIVLCEDYPIFATMMRRYQNGGFREQTRRWLAKHADLREHILECLRADGPLASAEIEDHKEDDRVDTDWGSGRKVPIMLDYLWMEGRIMVAGRRGQTRLWDLAERFFPPWTPQEELSQEEARERATEHALRAQGVATPRHLRIHFTRTLYVKSQIVKHLRHLQKAGRVLPIRIQEPAGKPWPGDWYIHRDQLPLLQSLQQGNWQPRTTLLSPFDNLICDRDRTEQLFNFYFRIEIYVPKAKREYGYYVLPILHGDRLIGRVDPKMDRKHHTLEINGLFAEPDVDLAATGPAVAQAISELAHFLGARTITFPQPERLEPGWVSAVKGL